jgi:hypothetical protein
LRRVQPFRNVSHSLWSTSKTRQVVLMSSSLNMRVTISSEMKRETSVHSHFKTPVPQALTLFQGINAANGTKSFTGRRRSISCLDFTDLLSCSSSRSLLKRFVRKVLSLEIGILPRASFFLAGKQFVYCAMSFHAATQSVIGCRKSRKCWDCWEETPEGIVSQKVVHWFSQERDISSIAGMKRRCLVRW